MKKLILFVSVLLTIISCTDKKTQTKGGDIADSTAVGAATQQEGEATAQEDDYDLEAIAKVIEGCEDLGSFSYGLAGVKKGDKVGYIDKSTTAPSRISPTASSQCSRATTIFTWIQRERNCSAHSVSDASMMD